MTRSVYCKNMENTEAVVSVFQSIVLGIVQGFSEFLPISSSAHLILAPYFLKWDDPGLAFDVALHMGTLAAILGFFWRDWLAVLKQVFTALQSVLSGDIKGAIQTITAPKPDSVPVGLLILGTIPAAIIGLLLEKLAEETFRAPVLIAVTLGVFGSLLWFWDSRGSKTRDVAVLSVRDALFVGLAQALAVIPGVSRSGITITTALALGFTRPAAARFSFLLSAPIIAGAGILKMKHIFHTLKAGGEAALAVEWGFAASLISGLLAVSLLSYMVKSTTYKAFAYYRIALALVIIVIVVIVR